VTPSYTGKADVHIHSRHSDGAADIRTILHYACTHSELDVIAIADHDTLEGSLRARDLARRYPIEAIPAMEVTSAHGHILALFIERPIPRGLSAEETIALIHEQSGLAIAAHAVEPFSEGLLSLRPRPLSLEQIRRMGVDALEVFNAGLTIPPIEWLGYLAARQIGAAATGGSDAHYLGTIGRGVTLFPGRSAEDFRQAVLERKTQVGGSRYALKHYAGHFWHRRLSHTRVALWAVRQLAPAYARTER
jgi:predicted metal-dependent phosphoesterase TrpH